MFENTREKKERLNPKRSQLRNFSIKRNRRADQERDRRMIDTSSRDEGDGTDVIDLVCVRVDPFVELRGSAEDQRPEKSRRSNGRHRSTPARAAFH